MRRRYKRFARNTYRFLRNRKRRRENRFFEWLGSRVLNRGLWKPDRNTIATGVAIGAVVSMLPPIPVQMLVAALVAVLIKGNIPAAAAACWISNPVTWLPILHYQRRLGHWLLRPDEFDAVHPGFHMMRSTALGAIVFAMILAPLAYFGTRFIWDLCGWTAKSSKKMVPLAAVTVKAPPESDSKTESPPDVRRSKARRSVPQP